MGDRLRELAGTSETTVKSAGTVVARPPEPRLLQSGGLTPESCVRSGGRPRAFGPTGRSQEVGIPRKSALPGSRHSQEVGVPRKSAFPGSRHSQEVGVPRKSAFPGSRHSQEVGAPRKSAFPGSRRSQEVGIPRKSAVPGSRRFREVGGSGTLAVPGRGGFCALGGPRSGPDTGRVYLGARLAGRRYPLTRAPRFASLTASGRAHPERWRDRPFEAAATAKCGANA